MIGRPRITDLVFDALSRLRRPIVPTAVAVLVLFAGTTAVFGTTGIALASQQRTLVRLNSPQGRLITITDAQGTAGLSAESVAAVSGLSGVEWAAGIGPATDAGNVNLPSAVTVPARFFYGDLPPVIRASTDAGRGQALTGPGLATTLRLGDGVGAISSRIQSAVVVGSFVADDPLTALNHNVLVRGTADEGRLLTLWVSAQNIAGLPALRDAVSATVIADQPASLRIDTADELASLSEGVITDMARAAQLTISGLLVAVTILVSAVQFGRVAGMARDIGRRRALGASQSLIVTQVLAHAGLCGLLGTTLGVATGLALSAVIAHSLPPASFCTGVAVLMMLAALAGALPPAIRAARLDPVRILRVP